MIRQIDIYDYYNDNMEISIITNLLSDDIKKLYKEWYMKAQNSNFKVEFIDYVKTARLNCVIIEIGELEAESVFV